MNGFESQHMDIFENLLIVGGTGRNVGKTEFVCRLIQKFSSQKKIYALKVSSIFPDEELFHGDHSNIGGPINQQLFEEIRLNTTKDTSRMLRAGGHKVFYLRSDDKNILSRFAEFISHTPTDALIVCESNSLWQFVKPGLFIMVTSETQVIKQRSKKQLKKADLVIISDGKNGFPDIAKIEITGINGWKLK